jgi:hypothetical protein
MDGHALYFEGCLLCLSYEGALESRQAPAELLRLRHLPAKHERLSAIRQNNATVLTGKQLRRLAELDKMDNVENLEDLENSAEMADRFVDTSLLEVNKQIHEEAWVEFVRINEFFVEDRSEFPDGTDTAVFDNPMIQFLRVYHSRIVRSFKHAVWMKIGVSWQEVAVPATYLRGRQDLKEPRIIFFGPAENKYELESFLHPLRILKAGDLSLASLVEGEEERLRRERHTGLE